MTDRGAGSRCQQSSKRTLAKVLENDTFAEKYRFKLPEGKSDYFTVKGCITTIIVVTALLFYGTIRYIKLETYDDTDIMVSQWDYFY